MKQEGVQTCQMSDGPIGSIGQAILWSDKYFTDGEMTLLQNAREPSLEARGFASMPNARQDSMFENPANEGSAVIRKNVNKMAACAARKRRLTVEDVVSVVSTEESNSVASEPLSNSFSNVLSKVLDEFDCLDASIDIKRFKCEARSSLGQIFIKCALNPTPEDHLNILLGSRVHVGLILAKEVLLWVNLVSRRL